MTKYLFRIALLLAVTAGVIAAGRWAARSYLARGLAERAADPESGAVLLPQLAELDGIALSALAEAAASPHRTHAATARREIRRLQRRWIQLEAERPDFDGDQRRLELARELLKRADRFTPSGQQWLAATADRLLRTQSGEAVNLRLIAVCDELLLTTHHRAEILDRVETRLPTIAADLPIDATPPQPVAARPPTPRYASRGPLPPAASPLSRSLNPPPRSGQVVLLPPPPQPAATEPAPIETPAIADAKPLPRRLDWQSPEEPSHGSRRFRGRRGLLYTVDALHGVPQALAVLTVVADRPLLKWGLESNDPLALATLAARGFAEASRDQLGRAVSDQPLHRLRLIDDLLASPGGSAARLLLLLATDESPRVRAAAVDALGKSRNPSLVDAAWRIAVRDPDPRVARLAGELRRR